MIKAVSQIKKISAIEITDSRGLPTVEATVELSTGSVGIASVPSGTSKGIHEALELRDGDKNRYGGYGVLKAVENVNGVISQTLMSTRAEEQRKIDDALNQLDGTGMKSRLGANATLAVSLAVARAQATEGRIPLYKYIREYIISDSNKKYTLPNPMVNVIEGGVHVKGGLDFQEFLVSPVGFRFFSEGVANVKKLMKSLQKLLKQKKIRYGYGLEGGFAPALQTNEEALKLIREAEEAEELFKEGFALGVDIAASNIFKEGVYLLKDRQEHLYRDDYIDFLQTLAQKYKLATIEDPLNESDWEGWGLLNQKIGSKTIIIGDDSTTTNVKRLTEALQRKTIGGVIVKPNQIGTLTETVDFALEAKKKNLTITVSHRSGETQDSFIADLSVALNANFAKIGAPSQIERIAKYTRLQEIEKELFEGSE